MELQKAKTLISDLYSIRLNTDLNKLVDQCAGMGRWEINNIVRKEMEKQLTEFGIGGLATVIFVLVGDGNVTE